MEKIRDRIRKLLRLARDKGASENEAAVALSLANKLMLEHNIEHVGEEEEETRVVHGSRMDVDRDERWESFIASATAKLFNCRSVMWKGTGAHAFVGRAENVAICEETFPWICEQVEALYKEGLKAFKNEVGGLNRATRADFRKTFKEACAIRIYRRVAEIVAANRGNIPEHKALVVIDQSLAQADDLLQKQGVSQGRALRRMRSGLGTGAGTAAGNSVKLQDDLSHTRSNPAARRIGDGS